MIKISIVTPCRNAEKYIRETVESVILQTALLSGRAELEYIICDGFSTDKTVEIAEAAAKGFRYGAVRIVSQPDRGMYDALAKGIKIATGDIVAYLNAGDYYNKYAFDIVLNIFSAKKTQWLTGYSVVYNDRSHVVYSILPYKYRKRFFSCGFYGQQLLHVQQESTFWSSALSPLIDYDKLSNFKYAGDFYLWFQFSRKYDLDIVEAYLGGFRMHKGQLSENMSAYNAEMATIITKPHMIDHLLVMFDKIMWYAPNTFKKKMNKEGLFRYDHSMQEWV
jgi:glycosyltransferase involved in cell wall biosynthesis